MSEPKFTPGPWMDQILYGIYVHQIMAGDDIVFTLKHGADHGVDHANIALIAAAPDLYEALENLVRAESAHGNAYDSDRIFTADNLDVARTKARAALAKARGES